MNLRRSFGFLLLLVALTAMGPFAMQIFLPALPAIQLAYDVNVATAQLVFSLSGMAMALGTLAYGPLADRHGRRPVLLWAIVLFVVGSLIATFAQTIEVLIAGRFIQAAGGVAGLVLTRTIVRDLFDRSRSAEMIAWLTTGMVAVPMVSPALGGVFVDFFSWRLNFLAPAVAGVLLFAVSYLYLTETRPDATATAVQKGFLPGAGQLIRHPQFIGYTLHGAGSFAAFFAFLAGAPYVVQKVMDQPATAYGLWFIINAFGFMMGNLTAARLSAWFGIDRMIAWGTGLVMVGVAVTLIVMMAGHWSPAALFVPMMVVAYGQGIAMPNAQAGALSVNPNLAGTASGVAGFTQMALASVIAQVVGMIQNGTPYPMLIVMLLCGCVMAGSLLLIRRPDAAAVGRPA
ncbi:MAG: Bcr/CflA family efflux MFS transporter [Geminicoccaceae bacterium]|nr:MAG: Bcr/CflA family efflux MFS transporter [Geminicoccaceae bacterium]